MFTRLLQRVDTHRLSGVTSVLGIEFDGDEALVVELKRFGNPLNKFSGSFKAVHSLTISVPRSTASADKGRLIKEALAAKAITTRWAVTSLRSAGVRYVSAKIPPEIDDLSEWVHEHAEKLLNLPVPAQDFSFAVQKISSDNAGTSVLVTFARNSDVAESRAIMAAAGLELLALGAGLGDASNALFVTEPANAAGTTRLVHVGFGLISVLQCADGRCTMIAAKPCASGMSPQEALQKAEEIAGNAQGEVVLSGRVVDAGAPAKALRPFGVLPEYAVATGLALKPFFPSLHPVDFLDAEGRQHDADILSKGFLNRAVLACGAVLMVLLLLPFAAGIFMQSRDAALDDELAKAGQSAGELAALEKQVAFLNESNFGGPASSSRSNTAHLMHEVARLCPDEIALSSLSVDGSDRTHPVILLAGKARSREAVTGFLQSLRASPLWKEPVLRRMGSKPESGVNLTMGSTGTGVYFDISAVLVSESTGGNVE